MIFHKIHKMLLRGDWKQVKTSKLVKSEEKLVQVSMHMKS